MKKIYIPFNLDLSKIIEKDQLESEKHYQNELEKYYYFVHLIYEQRVLSKIKDEYVPLKQLYLRKIVRDYQNYVKTLRDKGIVARDCHYIKGKKSYGYKLLPPYSEVKYKQIELTNQKLINNINVWKNNRIPETDVHLHLYKFIEQISINYNSALEYIEKANGTIQEYNCAKMSIDKFLNKEFFMYEDDYGHRIHTNITTLKSDLRKFLSFQGKKLINIDIINSQPLFLLLIPSFIYTIRCAVFFGEGMDTLTYKDWAERGVLYDNMMERAGITDRKEFKEKFFCNFFGKYTSKMFREIFPSITEIIEEIKKEDYKKLSYMMQRAESNLMINTICRRIMNEHPDLFIATIHDSILTVEENVPKIKKIMLEEFKNVGLLPSMRVEST